MDRDDGHRLELDDIQSGALHERPSPYVGTYLLLRIDDRAAGRELVRRLHRLVDSRQPVVGSRPRHLDHGGLHLPRLRGARGAAGVAGQLRAGVPGGDGGPRRRCWATSARAAPTHWEKPLGTADVHVAVAALSPDADAARRRPPTGPAAPTRSCPASS